MSCDQGAGGGSNTGKADRAETGAGRGSSGIRSWISQVWPLMCSKWLPAQLVRLHAAETAARAAKRPSMQTKRRPCSTGGRPTSSNGRPSNRKAAHAA